MSLRTYFDSALKKGDARETAEERRAALGLTVKNGDEAARHLQQTQGSLKKLRAHQAKRRKASA